MYRLQKFSPIHTISLYFLGLIFMVVSCTKEPMGAAISVGGLAFTNQKEGESAKGWWELTGNEDDIDAIASIRITNITKKPIDLKNLGPFKWLLIIDRGDQLKEVSIEVLNEPLDKLAGISTIAAGASHAFDISVDDLIGIVAASNQVQNTSNLDISSLEDLLYEANEARFVGIVKEKIVMKDDEVWDSLEKISRSSTRINGLAFYQKPRHIQVSNKYYVSKNNGTYANMICCVKNNTSQRQNLNNVSIEGSYTFLEQKEINGKLDLMALAEKHLLSFRSLEDKKLKSYFLGEVRYSSSKELYMITKDTKQANEDDSYLDAGKNMSIKLAIPIATDSETVKQYSAVLYKLVINGTPLYGINKLN